MLILIIIPKYPLSRFPQGGKAKIFGSFPRIGGRLGRG